MGMNEIPWYRWTLYLTFIYTILTILVCFHRQDFLNVRLIAFDYQYSLLCAQLRFICF